MRPAQLACKSGLQYERLERSVTIWIRCGMTCLNLLRQIGIGTGSDRVRRTRTRAWSGTLCAFLRSLARELQPARLLTDRNRDFSRSLAA
jgi:hypothetical protein